MNRNEIAIENIKKLRKSKDLSLEKMADLISKSRSAYDRLEKGEVELTLNEAESIASKLGSDFNTITNAGMVFNNEKNTVFGQGTNPVINLKLDDEQFDSLLKSIHRSK
jgi:transcriptional regulator with XRE-family HTH domain